MPSDSIITWIDNEPSFYNDKNAMFDGWIEAGERINDEWRRGQAVYLAAHVAEAIEAMPGARRKYSGKDIQEAALAMLEQFEDYRDEAIKIVVERASAPLKPEEYMMDPGDIEHAKKYEAVSQKIGIDLLKSLIPVSPEKIRSALSRGDQHLNTIPLRKWDTAAMSIRGPGLSLSDKVCALKHVARWHYA